MSAYPHKYKIFEYEDLDGVKKCKYVLKLSFEVIYVEKNYYEVGLAYPYDTKVVPKYRFVLFIENVKTGETYCVNRNYEKYPKTFKMFVDSFR